MTKNFADAHPETTAFYRFADFENYYKLREAQDKYLYNESISIGGKLKTEHPLSFVIEGSAYLKDWFGNGIETKIPIRGIKENHIVSILISLIMFMSLSLPISTYVIHITTTVTKSIPKKILPHGI